MVRWQKTKITYGSSRTWKARHKNESTWLRRAHSWSTGLGTADEIVKKDCLASVLDPRKLPLDERRERFKKTSILFNQCSEGGSSATRQQHVQVQGTNGLQRHFQHTKKTCFHQGRDTKQRCLERKGEVGSTWMDGYDGRVVFNQLPVTCLQK